ncbi:MAG: hypothetical protein K9W43_11375 [Candidatus Thorarchaeota archaeon]|nr:hypothetical protein [Candidatus Thorarchaeota archaeon]
MALENYLPRVRAAVRLLIEAGLQENDPDMRRKAERGISEIKTIVKEIIEMGRDQVVGIEAKKALNEVAYILGFQDGNILKIALGIREEKKPDYVPPPPP